MQIKKHPKKDLRRWSLIFFQIGMILVLLIAWWAIESKTYEKQDDDEVQIVKYKDLEPEDVVVTEKPKTDAPPPPPPPKVQEELTIVEDDEEVEEDEIETVEDIEVPKVEVADISEIETAPDVVEDQEIESVPFSVIQDVPIFPGCEKYKDNEDRKKCMSDKINQFVNRRFNTDLAVDLGLSGITRINVQFTVDENGNVVDIMTRAPERALGNEAERVVKMLPSMQPGKQRGKEVKVIYQLPIVFQVN
ncbi:MAG TPA: energy transducer TonB [Flavobacteriaceae bacterium]|nr:energy transducer TonB [Flavobacteriaceae bacterium]